MVRVSQSHAFLIVPNLESICTYCLITLILPLSHTHSHTSIIITVVNVCASMVYGSGLCTVYSVNVSIILLQNVSSI